MTELDPDDRRDLAILTLVDDPVPWPLIAALYDVSVDYIEQLVWEADDETAA